MESTGNTSSENTALANSSLTGAPLENISPAGASPATISSEKPSVQDHSDKILAIDIGGSHIKGTILNTKGEWQMDYKRTPTPPYPTAAVVVNIITELVKGMPSFDKISVGFPGYTRNGIIYTGPNLGADNWINVDLGQQIANALQKPVRLVNDADQLGLGVASGKGYEMVVTLGTGMGTALLMDGALLPHLELSHHPVSKGRDYDEYIGDKALKKEGKEKWNMRMQKVLGILKLVTNYDRLYLGGGSCDKISFKLDDNIKVFTNKDGIKGGARLWDLKDGNHISTNHPVKS